MMNSTSFSSFLPFVVYYGVLELIVALISNKNVEPIALEDRHISENVLFCRLSCIVYSIK
jgi:hypothetical protein